MEYPKDVIANPHIQHLEAVLKETTAVEGGCIKSVALP